MSVTIICHGCGQAFPLPEDHVRNKIQCSACGVICPVPEGAGRSSSGKGKVGKKAAPPSPSFDPLSVEPKLPAEKPRPVPDFNPFDGDPPEVQKRPPPPEMWFGCRRCGRKVRRQGECPSCDGAPEVAPSVPRLELEEPVPSTRDEEEDGSPYLLVDKDKPTCPKCRKEMLEGSVLCVACGFNQRTRKKAAQEFQPLARSWEANMPFEQRLFWWGVGVGVVLVGGLIGATLADVNILGFLFSWLFFATVMAFLLGTFDKIVMTRDSKGRVVVTKTWRFLFVAVTPRVYEVRGYEGVVSGQWSDTGFWEWFIFFWLFPMGIVPGVLWWWHILRKPAFHVALARDHGHPEVYVYRGRRQEQMRDIADTLCNATGLKDVG